MYRRLTSPNFIFACLLGLITTLLVPKLALAALVTPHDLPGGGVESTQDLAEKIRIQKNIDSQLQENNSTLYYSALDVPSKTTIQPILLWNPSIASRANVMSQIVGGITVSLGKMKSFYEAQIPGSRIDVGQVIVAQSSKTYPADCFDSNKVFQHSECGSMSQEILDDAMNRFMVGGGVLNVVYLPGSRHTRQLAAYTWKTDKSKAIAYVRHDAVPNIGLLDPNYDQGINSSSDQAVTHELGHGMGLAHSFPNSLMGGVGSAFSDIVLFNSASYPEKYVACNSSYNAGAKSCSFVSPTASNFQQATVTGRLSCKFNKSMIRTSPVSGTFKICEAIKGSSTYERYPFSKRSVYHC